MITALIVIVLAQMFALIVLALKFRSFKDDNAMELVELEYEVKAEINALDKKVYNGMEDIAKEVLELKTTTIRGYEDSRGELIITSPDGKTTIDEFKLRKQL